MQGKWEKLSDEAMKAILSRFALAVENMRVQARVGIILDKKEQDALEEVIEMFMTRTGFSREVILQESSSMLLIDQIRYLQTYTNPEEIRALVLKRIALAQVVMDNVILNWVDTKQLDIANRYHYDHEFEADGMDLFNAMSYIEETFNISLDEQEEAWKKLSEQLKAQVKK